MGVTTMKMIRSTRHTSISGVTLISDVIDAWLSFPSELADSLFIADTHFLHEVDRHLRTRVGHLDREAIHAVLEVVVSPDGGNRDEQAAGSGEERFGDTGRNGRDTTAALGHTG